MTPEALRAIVKDAEAWDGKLMSEWDAVRATLLSGHSRAISDLPRLMFESNVLAPLLEAIEEGAAEIERLRAAGAELIKSAELSDGGRLAMIPIGVYGKFYGAYINDPDGSPEQAVPQTQKTSAQPELSGRSET